MKSRLKKFWIILTGILLLSCTKEPVAILSENELVMKEGMSISVTNSYGTLKITAGKGTLRHYTWAGAMRSVPLLTRRKRWNGSLGLYYPGEGNHWEKHDGITRAVLEEGQQHFKTVDAAMEWIKKENHWEYIYRDDGLVVGWEKLTGAGGTLSVAVWQILINGKKPISLPGSHNDKISVQVES